MEYGPTFHGTNPGKRSVSDRLLDARGPRPRAAARRARRRRGRELHAAGAAATSGSSTTTSSARRADVILLRMPAFGLDGPWRDRQRLRADHRAGVGHRVDDRRGAEVEAARAQHHRPDRRDPRRVRGAGRARAPRPHRRGPADRDADGRGGAERRRRADRHVVGVRHAARARGQPRAARARRRASTRAAATSSGSRCRSSPTSEWRALVRVLGDPDVGTRRRRSRPAPVAARATTTIDAALAEWFAGRDRDDAVDASARRGRARGAGLGPEDPGRAPAARRRAGFTQWLDHPVAGPRRLPGHRPPVADSSTTRYRAPAPTVGQHTDRGARASSASPTPRSPPSRSGVSRADCV